jgi:hypothetical protein
MVKPPRAVVAQAVELQYQSYYRYYHLSPTKPGQQNSLLEPSVERDDQLPIVLTLMGCLTLVRPIFHIAMD